MDNTLVAPRKRAVIAGVCYWPVYLFLLPNLLSWILKLSGAAISAAQGNLLLNLVYFLTNFLFIIVIFHRYLYESFAPLRKNAGKFVRTIAIGFAAYYSMSLALNFLFQVFELIPENKNNEAVVSLIQTQRLLMGICTVVLVPITEECLCRGVIFGPIYQRRPWLAYVLSSVVFSFLHVQGYIGVQSLPVLLLSFVQYLPAGVALGWVYQRTGSIWSSIGLHAVINFMGVMVS